MHNPDEMYRMWTDWNKQLAKLADELDERLANAENEIRQVRDLLAKLK